MYLRKALGNWGLKILQLNGRLPYFIVGISGYRQHSHHCASHRVGHPHVRVARTHAPARLREWGWCQHGHPHHVGELHFHPEVLHHEGNAQGNIHWLLFSWVLTQGDSPEFLQSLIPWCQRQMYPFVIYQKTSSCTVESVGFVACELATWAGWLNALVF